MGRIDINVKNGVIRIHSDDPEDKELIRDMMETIMIDIGKKRGKKLVKGKDYTMIEEADYSAKQSASGMDQQER